MKAKVEAKLTDLRTALSSNAEVPALKSSMDALQAEVMAMGQAMYSAQGAAGAPGAQGAPGAGPGAGPSDGKKPGSDNDVIDAE